MLPLLVGGHFVVAGGGRGPFFLFGFLCGALGGVGGFLGRGGDERVDGEDDEEGVEGAVGWLITM